MFRDKFWRASFASCSFEATDSLLTTRESRDILVSYLKNRSAADIGDKGAHISGLLCRWRRRPKVRIAGLGS